MAIRKELSRRRRISDQDIENLRDMTAAGLPWSYVAGYEHHKGRGDLIFLVKGFFYIGDFLSGPDDIETATELWWILRGDIVGEQARHRPFSRPWAWWAIEDREPRRRLDAKPCACVVLPQHGAKFAPLSLSWFGTRRDCECEYERERDYLERQKLSLPNEGYEILNSTDRTFFDFMRPTGVSKD